MSFTPTPAASDTRPRPAGGSTAPALSSSANASESSTSVSLCAPPTASTSSTGFSPMNASAKRRERPRRPAARAVSQIAARLHTADSAFNVQIPPPSPSGATA